MAAVMKNEIPMEAAFMPQFWELIKKYWLVESTDGYWEQLIEDANRIMKRFPSDFTRRQVTAYLDYLEAQEKKLREGKYVQHRNTGLPGGTAQ